MKLVYQCKNKKCSRIFTKDVPQCEINKEVTFCPECGRVALIMYDHLLEEIKMANAKYEEYNGYFNKIRELCVEAYKLSVVADEKWFIDHGIPEAFMKKCKKSHLYGGGKGKQNLYWNWTKNLKYPNSTISNFLDYLKLEED